MDYELAKELKNCGFSQDERDHTGQHWTDGISVYDHPVISDEDECLIPTLEQLIEECQPYFHMLICIPKIQKSDFNGNLGDIIQKGGYEALSNLDNIAAIGSTHKEAVAKLWLALRNK